MGPEYNKFNRNSVNNNNKYVEANMEDSGNSCGSSVVSDQTDDIYDMEDSVQISDLDGEIDNNTEYDHSPPPPLALTSSSLPLVAQVM